MLHSCTFWNFFWTKSGALHHPIFTINCTIWHSYAVTSSNRMKLQRMRWQCTYYPQLRKYLYNNLTLMPICFNLSLRVSEKNHPPPQLFHVWNLFYMVITVLHYLCQLPWIRRSEPRSAVPPINLPHLMCVMAQKSPFSILYIRSS